MEVKETKTRMMNHKNHSKLDFILAHFYVI